MGMLVYECYNSYNEDNVKFYKDDQSLKIIESNGCNAQIKDVFTIEVDRDDVIGLIEFLKNQFNIE